MSNGKTALLVGRWTRRSTMVVYLGRPSAPIVGPFTLHAVVSPN